ncbi:EamA family transporter RarD [Spongiactinospora gelatinilytica]|uniref:EamA family transporter RarD n=1 Tax=Spongiactinospora gelatinilytica TaxID=2666298 RepID=A0A2W2H5M6_9ACTN|nr:EamA family transporter RarD [Spongiactinospora gelatinilytica]PZG55782.1 EamA family transporter RarD [Spongiactinospora gelatinilytica]
MPDEQRGVLYGATAYALWGVFPLYWPLLEPASSLEMLAHRMAWSLIAVVGILAARRHWSWVRPLLRQPGRLGLLALAAVLITFNWGTYIYAVTTGHVVESALGYFINPLVSVMFGVVLLHERLRPAQWAAVGLGTVAVLVLTLDYGRLPWIALVLSVSFGTYGLVKKMANVGAAESLTVESLLLFFPALGYLLFLQGQGAGTFVGHGWGHTWLLATSGMVTVVPLLLFTAAAIRVPLTVIGLLQYIAPVLQFLTGVLIVRETMPAERWAGFAIVWVALGVFTWDALRQARRSRIAAQAVRPQPERATT